MKGLKRRRHAKSPIELIEEAVCLVRGSDAGTLGLYYAGALPFVLGALYFWTDMSRSPAAEARLAPAALGMALLFVWMKFWQALFARRLRAFMTGEKFALKAGECRRILVAQAALQSSGFVLLPLSALLILPFGWAYAFYQSLTVAGGTNRGLKSVIQKSAAQAALWPKQNYLVLFIMFGFGLFVFINLALGGFSVPFLLKMFFDIETVFTRSSAALLNSTCILALFGLTYLCVDPILKAVYALRCFYGESLQSGDDLKAQLTRCSAAEPPSALPAAALIFLLVFATQNLAHGVEVNSGPGPQPVVAAGEAAPVPPRPGEHRLEQRRISPDKLDTAIREVLQQRKFTWRLPKEEQNRSTSGQGVIRQFLYDAAKMVGEWLERVGGWITEKLGKWFRFRMPRSGSGTGYGWVTGLNILAYALIAAVLIALAILLIRAWRGRNAQRVISSQAIPGAPDVSSENTGPEELPGDSWMKLGRELLERGEVRLALRAFYLASLAHLAERGLIDLARYKSNRDYERELLRRGHALADLPALFGRNVSLFEHTWYGTHEINAEGASRFAADVERIRAGV